MSESYERIFILAAVSGVSRRNDFEGGLVNWHKVWSERVNSLDISKQSGFSLGDLIALDGFDTGAGEVGEEAWTRNVDSVRLRLRARRGDSLLEVGCGAGAFLRAFGEGIDFFGFDYSSGLLQVAKKVIPTGSFVSWDLNQSGGKFPPPDKAKKLSYDFVVAHGVLHYLKESHALEVVREALRYSSKGVFVGEVPRLEKQLESEAARRSLLTSEEYALKYSGLEHTYFRESSFAEILTEPEFEFKWDLSVIPRSLLESGQQEFRFAALFLRVEE